MNTIENLKALMAKATPLPLAVNRYYHGGGRLYREEPRKLVADFYDEADRELFISMRNALPDLLAAIEAAKVYSAQAPVLDMIHARDALCAALSRLTTPQKAD